MNLFTLPRNAVVTASAGTGKTHCLVGVLVHLVLGATTRGSYPRGPIDPGRIAATTFSRRAAAEISARVTHALTSLAGDDPAAPFALELDATCRDAPFAQWSRGERAARARHALSARGRLRVGTMHGLASGIVRAHALEVDLSPGFDFADEEQSRERAAEIVARVLAAHAEVPEVRLLSHAASGLEALVANMVDILERLVEDGGDAAELRIDDDAAAIERTFGAFVEHARNLAADPSLGTCATAFLEALDTSEARALVQAAGVLCSTAARGKRTPEAEAFLELRASLPGATNEARGLILARSWLARSAPRPLAVAARTLLAECERELRQAALRDGLLSFSDVLRLARDLLRDHPEVATEVGRGLDALLVDEFQDTSRLQRELVLLLWEGAPERRRPGVSPTLRDIRGEGLLVVGDRKQSIYAFRGADVGSYAEVCVGLAGAPARQAFGLPPGSVWEPEAPTADFFALRHNRRARPELLSFVNAFAPRCFRKGEGPSELFEVAYVPTAEDLLPPQGSPPLAAAAVATWLRVSPVGDALTSSRVDEATAVACEIAGIVDRGEPRIRGAPPRRRDIAVLSRGHEALDAAADAIARAGIPYVIAGRGFFLAREVRDLASMLALVLDPLDRLALLEVLRGPWAGVRDETLLALVEPGRGLAPLGPAWDAAMQGDAVCADDREALQDLRSVVEPLRAVAHRLRPAEILREAVRTLRFDQVLSLLPRGEQRVANVRKLLRLAECELDPYTFLERLERAAEEEAAEAEGATFTEGDDAVRLLTVHASKGLDFPIVFALEAGAPMRRNPQRCAVVLDPREQTSALVVRVADADGFVWEPPSYREAMRRATRRGAAEHARLWYVAVTRASEALFLVGDRRTPRAVASAGPPSSAADALRDLVENEEGRSTASFVVVDATP